MEELLKALELGGDLAFGPAGWEWKPRSPGDWRLPPSIRQAVSEQVASLSVSARAISHLAAVIGRRFDLRLLHVLSRLDEPDLVDAVKELMEAQLVLEEAPDVFTFRHALAREAVYVSLLGRERVALHREVAEASEALYACAPDPQLDELSLHFYQAGIWDKALVYCQQAGDHPIGSRSPAWP